MEIPKNRWSLPVPEGVLPRLLTNLLLWVQPNTMVEPQSRGKQCCSFKLNPSKPVVYRPQMVLGAPRNNDERKMLKSRHRSSVCSQTFSDSTYSLFTESCHGPRIIQCLSFNPHNNPKRQQEISSLLPNSDPATHHSKINTSCWQKGKLLLIIRLAIWRKGQTHYSPQNHLQRFCSVMKIFKE